MTHHSSSGQPKIGVSKAQAVRSDVGHLGEVANRCRALHLNMMDLQPQRRADGTAEPGGFVGEVEALV